MNKTTSAHPPSIGVTPEPSPLDIARRVIDEGVSIAEAYRALAG
ncbi:hypothetical protein GCM10022282_13490 [Agromyces indicus]